MALDPLIHAPARLQICALLSAVEEAEFAVLREETGVSDSVLSKHIRQLEEARYVKVRKAGPGVSGPGWRSRGPADRLAAHTRTDAVCRPRGWRGVTSAARPPLRW